MSLELFIYAGILAHTMRLYRSMAHVSAYGTEVLLSVIIVSINIGMDIGKLKCMRIVENNNLFHFKMCIIVSI